MFQEGSTNSDNRTANSLSTSRQEKENEFARLRSVLPSISGENSVHRVSQIYIYIYTVCDHASETLFSARYSLEGGKTLLISMLSPFYKIDVLEEAIKYIAHLQAALENQTTASKYTSTLCAV